MANSNNEVELTLGQASCLVLCLPPTLENRKHAKKLMTESPFEITYLRSSTPMTPVAIGRNTKQLNPFVYCSYSETPQASSDEESDDEDSNVKTPSTNGSSIISTSTIGQRFQVEALAKSTQPAEKAKQNYRYTRARLLPQHTMHNKREENSAVTIPNNQTTTITSRVSLNNMTPITSRKKNPNSEPTTATGKFASTYSRATTSTDPGSENVNPTRKVTPGSRKPAHPNSQSTPGKRKSGQETPTNCPAASISRKRKIPMVIAHNETKAKVSASSGTDPNKVSRKKILTFLQNILSLKCVAPKDHYEYLFVTSAMQLDLVKQHFSRIDTLTSSLLARWVNETDFLSFAATFNGIKGRWLFVLKEEYRDL